MSSPLTAAGATTEPSDYATLSMDRQPTGLWTQRSPLRDAATPYTQIKFYGAERFDSLIDGLNREITSKLTDGRSPGSSVYNSQIFPPALSYYSWKYIQDSVEIIRVMLDGTDSVVYDATGPSTKDAIWNKAAAAGPTRFLGVGTELFFDNGIEQKKWVESGLIWKPNTLYDGAATSDTTLGDFIIDPNLNIQQAVGGFNVGVTEVEIAGDVLKLTLDQSQLQNPTGVPSGIVGTGGALPTGSLYAKVAAANALGLFTASGTESALVAVVGPNGSVQWTWAPVAGAVSYRIYVGTTPGGEDRYFTSTTNTYTQTDPVGTAGTPPLVNNALDDNLPLNLAFMMGVQLTLSGMTNATFLNGQTITIASVLPGGSDSNILTATFAHADYPAQPDTGSATSGTGITGGSQPVWSTALATVTQDGGAQWICRGSAIQNWGIATPATAPSVAQQQSVAGIPAWNSHTYYSTCGLIYEGANVIQKVTSYGTTGATIPSFNDPPGSTTNDGSVVWTSQGDGTYTLGAAVVKGQYIVTPNSAGKLCFYQAQNAGVSGAVTPIFPVPLGSQVNDNGVIWQNVGIGQTWNDITAATLNGGFATIPLSGGGSIAIGAGQNSAYGTTIPLPSGYTTANMLAWSTAANGNAGAQITGVAVSTAGGGVLQSQFQIRGGGTSNVNSNWIAVAWTAGAAVTSVTVGAFVQLSFTTANGDELVITVGTQQGGTIPTPGGFSSANFAGIVGMATVNATGHGMYGVNQAKYDGSLNMETDYNDNSSNIWGGAGNVLGIFWKTGGGVTSVPLTGGIAVLIPVSGTQQLAIVSQTIQNATNFTIPAGFSGGSQAMSCAMARYNNGGGSNVSHGWNLSVTGTFYTSALFDGGGTYSSGQGNIFALIAPVSTTPISPAREIDDSNGNLQQLQVSGLSGESAPAWSTTPGVLTMDNTATWLNVGIGTAAATAPTKYYYAYKNSVTKHVGTASPASAGIQPNAGFSVYVQGLYSNDPQVDTIQIYRPAQGETTPILVDEIPNIVNGPSTTWSYFDSIPDKSVNGGPQLNAEIAAATAHENDPPPTNMTAPCFHLQRIFAISGTNVVWSDGPDATIGSGNEAFDPINFIPFPAQPIILKPVTVQGGGILVYTTAGIYIILGTGTAVDPFYATIYYPSVSVLSYNAVSEFNTAHLVMEKNLKVSMIAVQYPFDPQSGYTEIGFGIGDQFQKVTTGGISEKLYNPATSYVSWSNAGTNDTALYVADGAVGWFRFAPTSPPETGYMWSPRRAIVGGTSAVQSIETSPGVTQLLIGPPAGTPGPILFRDDSTNADWSDGAYRNYPSWDVKGSIVLCQSGEWAEVAHIGLKSAAVGKKPVVSLLFDELFTAPPNVNFDDLKITSNDPPDLDPSQTMFSDRYTALQNGVCPKCDNFQLKVDYGEQNEPDELLMFSIYGAKHNERKQQ